MNAKAKGDAMQTSLLNRLTRGVSRFVGVMALIGAGPMLPLGAGIVATPSRALAQATGDDVIVFTSGKKITGKILEETATSVTIKFLAGGIEATATYQKSELLSVTKGTGQTTTPASPAKSTSATKQPEIKAAAATDPIGSGKKKVYAIELKGTFAEDITQTPMRQAVKDAKKNKADYIIFIIDNDWSFDRWGQKAEIADEQGKFDQLFRAEDMAPVFNEEIKREWDKQPTVVFWVKKAMGGAAFLPLSCRNIYMASEGKIGGIAGLNRMFTQGDKVVWEKQISLRLGHAEGLAIQGGYEPKLIKALCRDEYVLSYKIEGGKAIYLEREPEGPDEFLLTDDADEQTGNADTIEKLARGEGDDCLTINSDLAFKLGISKGTVDTMDDLLFKLGIARDHEFVSGNPKDKVLGSSKRITEGWIDSVADAKRKLKRLWDDFNRVEVAAPGQYEQRTQARGRQRSIIEDMQELLKKFEEAINPRAVPCPDWATLNIIKERLKTEQLQDRREPR